MEFQGQTVPESLLCFKTLAGEIEPISDYVTLGKQPPGTLKNSTRIRLIDSPTFLPDLSIREHLHLMGMPKNPESFNAFAPWKLDEIYDHPPLLGCPTGRSNERFYVANCNHQLNLCYSTSQNVILIFLGLILRDSSAHYTFLYSFSHGDRCDDYWSSLVKYSSNLMPALEGRMANGLYFPLLIITVLLSPFTLERYIPLQATTHEIKLYKTESLKCCLVLTFESLIQIICFGCFTALLAPTKIAALATLISIVIRFFIEFQPWRLSKLIEPERKQTAAFAPLFIRDSELVSHATAQANLSWPRTKFVLRILPLPTKRLLRRNYLVVFSILSILWSTLVSYQSPIAASILLLISQTIAEAGIIRCFRFVDYHQRNKYLELFIAILLGLIFAPAFTLYTGIPILSMQTLLFPMGNPTGYSFDRYPEKLSAINIS